MNYKYCSDTHGCYAIPVAACSETALQTRLFLTKDDGLKISLAALCAIMLGSTIYQQSKQVSMS